MAGAQAYGAYRASMAGGQYTVNIDQIDQLYDLFTYGEFTSLAMFRYSDFQIEKNENAKHLFIIGKGLDLFFIAFGKWYRFEPEYFHTSTIEAFKVRNLVPTAGSPGSEIQSWR